MLLVRAHVSHQSGISTGHKSWASSSHIYSRNLPPTPPHPDSANLPGYILRTPTTPSDASNLLRPRNSTREFRSSTSLYAAGEITLPPGAELEGELLFEVPNGALADLVLVYNSDPPIEVPLRDLSASASQSATPPDDADHPKIPDPVMVRLDAPTPWTLTDEGATLRIAIPVHLHTRFAVRTYRIPDLGRSVFLQLRLGDDPNALYQAAWRPDPETAQQRPRIRLRKEPVFLPGLHPDVEMTGQSSRTEDEPLWGSVDLQPGETLTGTLIFRVPKVGVLHSARLWLPDAEWGFAWADLWWPGTSALDQPLGPPPPVVFPIPEHPEHGLALDLQIQSRGRPDPLPEPLAEPDQLPPGKELLLLRATLHNRTIGLAELHLLDMVRLIADGVYQLPPVTPGLPGAGFQLALSDDTVILPLQDTIAELAFVVPEGFQGRLEVDFLPPGSPTRVRLSGELGELPPVPSDAHAIANAYASSRMLGVERATSPDGRPIRVATVEITPQTDEEANLPFDRAGFRLINTMVDAEQGTYLPDIAATLAQPWPLFQPDELPCHLGQTPRRYQVAFAVPEDVGDQWCLRSSDAGGVLELSGPLGSAVALPPDAPNRRPEDARPLKPGVAVAVTLSAGQRSWWFEITPDPGQPMASTLRVALDGRHNEGDLPVEAWLHGDGQARPLVFGERLDAVIFRPGERTLIEIFAGDLEEQDHTVELVWSLLGPADGGIAIETFSDSPALAHRLEPGRSVRGFTCPGQPGGDIEWFALVVPGAGTTRVRLRFDGDGEVALYTLEDVARPDGAALLQGHSSVPGFRPVLSPEDRHPGDPSKPRAPGPREEDPPVEQPTPRAPALLWPDLALHPGEYRIRVSVKEAHRERPYTLRADLEGPWMVSWAPAWADAPERANPLPQDTVGRAFLYKAQSGDPGALPRCTGVMTLYDPYWTANAPNFTNMPPHRTPRRLGQPGWREAEPYDARALQDNPDPVAFSRWFSIEIPGPEPVFFAAEMNTCYSCWLGVADERTHQMVALVDAAGQIVAETGWRLREGWSTLECVRRLEPQDQTIFLHAARLPPGRYYLEVKTLDPRGQLVAEQAITLRWTTLPLRAPERRPVPAMPPVFALGARAAYSDPDGQSMVRVDPGEEVVATVALSAGAYAMYPRNIAILMNLRGAMSPFFERIQADLPKLGAQLFLNDQITVVGVMGRYEILAPWTRLETADLAAAAARIHTGDLWDYTSLSLTTAMEALEEIYCDTCCAACQGPRVAIFITGTWPPFFGDFDPAVLALHYQRVQRLTGVKLRFLFLRRPDEPDALPEPWASLVAAATEPDGPVPYRYMDDITLLDQMVDEIVRSVEPQVLSGLQLKLDLPAGAALVGEAQPAGTLDPAPRTWMAALPDQAMIGRRLHSAAVRLTLKNEGQAPWLIEDQPLGAVRFVDPFGRDQVSQVSPALVPAARVTPGGAGPGSGPPNDSTSNDSLSNNMPSAYALPQGILSVDLRGDAPPGVRSLVIILDTSGSMSAETDTMEDGRPLSRLEVAKRAILALIDDAHAVPDGVRFALYTFAGGAPAPLRHIYPLYRGRSRTLRRKLAAVVPSGGTPIRASLDLVRALFEHRRIPSPSAVLLLTDGEPTGTNADVSADEAVSAAAALASAGHTRLHVIGVFSPGESDADDRGVLCGQRMAEAGGGVFALAGRTQEGLLDVLRSAVRPGYTVEDRAGNAVGTGVLSDAAEHAVRDFTLDVGAWYVRADGLADRVRVVVEADTLTPLILSARDGVIAVVE